MIVHSPSNLKAVTLLVQFIKFYLEKKLYIKPSMRVKNILTIYGISFLQWVAFDAVTCQETNIEPMGAVEKL